jgi:hypothetical protein
MPSSKLITTVARAVLAYVLLTLLLSASRGLYGSVAIRLYRWEIETFAPNYKILKFEVARENQQQYFILRVVQTDSLYVRGRLVPAESYEHNVGALVDSSLQHALFVFIVPLAWPGMSALRRFLALGLSVPALIAVEFIDIPWFLIGMLDHYTTFLTHGPESFASRWAHIMVNGGGLALSVMAGLIAGSMAECWTHNHYKSHFRPQKHSTGGKMKSFSADCGV